jgi:hypothetical protein
MRGESSRPPSPVAATAAAVPSPSATTALPAITVALTSVLIVQPPSAFL